MESVVWMRNRKHPIKSNDYFHYAQWAAAEDYITPHRIRTPAIVRVENEVASLRELQCSNAAARAGWWYTVRHQHQLPEDKRIHQTELSQIISQTHCSHSLSVMRIIIQMDMSSVALRLPKRMNENYIRFCFAFFTCVVHSAASS